MNMHEIKPKHQRPKKKKVGRGGKRGTYSGRGMKGQKARAGSSLAPVVRELLKRYPKLKGYRRVKRQRKPAAVSLQVIIKNFSKGEMVSPQTLTEKGLIPRQKGALKAKIVGTLPLQHPLSFQGCLFSAGARQVVEKSGGEIT